MSGEEGGGSGEGSALMARVFEFLRGMREQQRRDSRQLEQVSNLLLNLTEQVRRMDRRLTEMDRHLSDQKDDLELMLKAELMGQFGMHRAELGHRLDELADRITTLEGGDPWRVGTASGPRS